MIAFALGALCGFVAAYFGHTWFRLNVLRPLLAKQRCEACGRRTFSELRCWECQLGVLDTLDDDEGGSDG